MEIYGDRGFVIVPIGYLYHMIVAKGSRMVTTLDL